MLFPPPASLVFACVEGLISSGDESASGVLRGIKLLEDLVNRAELAQQSWK